MQAASATALPLPHIVGANQNHYGIRICEKFHNVSCQARNSFGKGSLKWQQSAGFLCRKPDSKSQNES
jgi:hypothetical protein